MFAEYKLKLANGGERTVGFNANAGLPIRYRNTFHKDAFKELSEMLGDIEKIDTLMGFTDFVPQLAYIMAMAAEGRDMNTLNMETYVAWLEQFSSDTFVDLAGEIIGLYMGSAENKSIPKN